MTNELFIHSQLEQTENLELKEAGSVCHTSDEQQKLLRLFEIFILVDKQLNEKSKQ